MIDFAFLAEKFETAPFWTVHNSLPSKNTKDALHAFWGRVFEQYSADVFQSEATPKLNAIHSGPVFLDEAKGQVCDLIIVCGISAAFVEVKGTTFSSRAKYGSDSNLLKAELDSKLVQGPNGEAKAVYQLKRAIELTCGSIPEPIRHLDLSKVSFIYPVLVTRDDIGSTFAVNAFLQVRFDAALNRRGMKKCVTPLFCIDAEDMERLSPYFGDTPVTDLFEAHYRANRKGGKYLLNSYFSTRDNEILKEKGARVPKVSADSWRRLTALALDHLGLRP